MTDPDGVQRHSPQVGEPDLDQSATSHERPSSTPPSSAAPLLSNGLGYPHQNHADVAMAKSPRPKAKTQSSTPVAPPPAIAQDTGLFEQALAFEGATAVSLVANRNRSRGNVSAAMEIVLDDGVMMTVELDSGEKRLKELGYEQTLQRDLTGFQLFAASFTCIGLFVGIVPYYGSAFANGGPVAVIWLWWIPGLFATLMTVSLAEIASSLPTAASMYFWAGFLAPRKMSNFATWFTGWLEFLGSSIGSAGTALAGIQVLNALILASNSTYIPPTGDSPGAWESGFVLNAGQQVGCAAAVLLLVASINCNRIGVLGKFLAAAAVFQMLVGLALIICLPIVAPTKQPASFVFGTILENWSAPSGAYAFVLALLLPQYSMYSMDCAAHTAEEAKHADVITPAVMVAAIVSIVVMGWGVLVAITFCIQDVGSLSDPRSVTQGTQAFVEIVWDIFFARYNSGTGAVVFMCMVYLGLFSASVAQMLTATRIAYALSRDGGIPFSNVFTFVNAQKVPVLALALTCAVSMVALLPLLFNITAYYALTSMATIGWFGSYAFPMVLRFVMPEDRFKPGPFYMARYVGVTGGKVVHGLGSVYALYTICSFMLPYAFPVEFDNFNYAPIVLAVVLGILIGWWVLDVRHWFKGPHEQDRSVRNGHSVIGDPPPQTNAAVDWF